MGGLFKSRDHTQQYSQVTLPDWLSRDLQSNNYQAQQLSQRGFQSYDAPRVAATNDIQGAAMGSFSGLSDYQAPQVAAGRMQAGNVYGYGAGQTLAGANLNPYLDPYVRNVVDTSIGEINRSTDQQLQQNSGQAAMSGAFGGDRAALVDTETRRNAEDLKARTAAGLYSQAYTNAQQGAQYDINNRNSLASTQAQLAQNANASNLQSLMQARLANQNADLSAAGVRANGATSLFNAGTLEQQTAQQDLNAQYEQFQRAINDPYQKLQFASNIANGVTPAFAGSEGNTYTPGPGMLGGLLGMGLTAISGAGAAGAFNKADGGIVGYADGGAIAGPESGGAPEAQEPGNPELAQALALLGPDQATAPAGTSGAPGFRAGGLARLGGVGRYAEGGLTEEQLHTLRQAQQAFLRSEARPAAAEPAEPQGGLEGPNDPGLPAPGATAPASPAPESPPAAPAPAESSRPAEPPAPAPRGSGPRLHAGLPGEPNPLLGPLPGIPEGTPAGAGAPGAPVRDVGTVAPFTAASAVLPPAPQAALYDRMIERLLAPEPEDRSEAEARSKAPWLALMQAGLGMMASRSPHFFNVLGEGGMQGMAAYQQLLAQEAAVQGKRADRRERRIETAMRLGETRETRRQNLELQLQNINLRMLDNALSREQRAELAAQSDTLRRELAESARQTQLTIAGQASQDRQAGQANTAAIADANREASQPEIVRLQRQIATLPEGDPRRAQLEDRIARLNQPPVSTQSPLARLMAERDALPPGDPRRAAYDQAIERETKGPRRQNTLTDKGREELSERGEGYTALTGLAERFRPGFAMANTLGIGSTVLGRLQNTVARNTPGESERANWWSAYNEQRNAIRNKLFGAAVTGPERADFDAANVTEGMSAETIRANLARQQSAARRAVLRLHDSYASDYEPETVRRTLGLSDIDAVRRAEEAYQRSLLRRNDGKGEGQGGAGGGGQRQAGASAPAGGQRVKVKTPEEAMRLPPGTPIELPDGRHGVVPGRAGQ